MIAKWRFHRDRWTDNEHRNHKWSNVTIEAEFFDQAGNFVDEAQEYVRTEIAGGAKEHFKIRVKSPSAPVDAGETKMELKISGGHTMPF